MRVLFQLFFLVFIFSFVSCAPEKPCSGLNPVIGTYNTSKKIHSAKKSVHSRPEKKAVKQRQKEIKGKKSRFSTKGRYSGSFHIGGNVGGGGNGGGNKKVGVKY